MKFFSSQLQMEQQNCQEETKNSEKPTPRREQRVRSQDLRGELQGELEGSQPTETKDDAEARSKRSVNAFEW